MKNIGGVYELYCTQDIVKYDYDVAFCYNSAIFHRVEYFFKVWFGIVHDQE